MIRRCLWSRPGCGADNAGCAPGFTAEVQQHISSILLCTMVMPHTAILALAIAWTSPPSGATSTSSAGWNSSARCWPATAHDWCFCRRSAAPRSLKSGHFELRGFRQHQSLYGLCQDGECLLRPRGRMARSRLYGLLVVNCLALFRHGVRA